MYMNEDKVHASMNSVIDNIKTNADFLKTLDRQIILGWLFLMLLIGVTSVKHEGFSEDKGVESHLSAKPSCLTINDLLD